jgi:hypothetical protein
MRFRHRLRYRNSSPNDILTLRTATTDIFLTHAYLSFLRAFDVSHASRHINLKDKTFDNSRLGADETNSAGALLSDSQWRCAYLADVNAWSLRFRSINEQTFLTVPLENSGCMAKTCILPKILIALVRWAKILPNSIVMIDTKIPGYRHGAYRGQ